MKLDEGEKKEVYQDSFIFSILFQEIISTFALLVNGMENNIITE